MENASDLYLAKIPSLIYNSALHYRYHISIIYTLSDKWKCFHKNNLESWLKTQVCCQDKQSSLKEDLFLFCSDKYVVSGL